MALRGRHLHQLQGEAVALVTAWLRSSNFGAGRRLHRNGRGRRGGSNESPDDGVMHIAGFLNLKCEFASRRGRHFAIEDIESNGAASDAVQLDANAAHRIVQSCPLGPFLVFTHVDLRAHTAMGPHRRSSQAATRDPRSNGSA